MPKFYGTFRFGDQHRRNKFVTLEAESQDDAQALMFSIFGDNFAEIYDEKNFAGQIEKFALSELPVSENFFKAYAMNKRLQSIAPKWKVQWNPYGKIFADIGFGSFEVLGPDETIHHYRSLPEDPAELVE